MCLNSTLHLLKKEGPPPAFLPVLRSLHPPFRSLCIFVRAYFLFHLTHSYTRHVTPLADGFIAQNIHRTVFPSGGLRDGRFVGVVRNGVDG
jgi:hypothetical protein